MVTKAAKCFFLCDSNEKKKKGKKERKEKEFKPKYRHTFLLFLIYISLNKQPHKIKEMGIASNSG